jgi:hypothetical protein
MLTPGKSDNRPYEVELHFSGNRVYRDLRRAGAVSSFSRDSASSLLAGSGPSNPS